MSNEPSNHKPEKEDLSFAALSQDIGNVPSPPAAPPQASDAPLGMKNGAAPEQAPNTAAGTSFADLMGDMPEPTPAPMADAPPSESATPAAHREEAADTMEDRLNARVLTGSASKPNPVWLQSIGLGGVSMVLFFLLRSAMGYMIVYLLAMIVALGAVAWGGYGLSTATTQKERMGSIAGLVLGALAMLFSFLMRRSLGG